MKPKHPEPKWSKADVRPCPSGKCKHLHIRKSGPCTQIGCGCHGTKK